MSNAVKVEAYQGRPCKYGHVGLRYKSSSNCVECYRTTDSLSRARKRTAARRKIPGVIEKNREYDKNRYQKPEVKLKHTETEKRRYQRPEVKKAISIYNQTPKRKESSRARSKTERAQLLSSTRSLKRRALLRGSEISDLTTSQWESIKKFYGYSCVYCGEKPKNLTQDHITPLSKGGNHTASNVVPACGSCNSKKYTGSPLVPVQPLLLVVWGFHYERNTKNNIPPTSEEEAQRANHCSS